MWPKMDGLSPRFFSPFTFFFFLISDELMDQSLELETAQENKVEKFADQNQWPGITNQKDHCFNPWRLRQATPALSWVSPFRQFAEVFVLSKHVDLWPRDLFLFQSPHLSQLKFIQLPKLPQNAVFRKIMAHR